jgi:hypothetical protein
LKGLIFGVEARVMARAMWRGQWIGWLRDIKLLSEPSPAYFAPCKRDATATATLSVGA